MNGMKLSLVVPCYNEAENVIPFQEAVIQAFDGCGYDYEIVFVDDGSTDATLHNLKKVFAAQACPVKVVSFSRNFGKEAGLYAGLRYASGEYISLIDADLQQRPELVRQMAEILDNKPEYDVVAAYQDRRGEGKILSFFKRSFYKIINALSKVSLQPDASDFRTFRRSVRDSILDLAEYHRFSKGIFAWVGFPTYQMPYQVEARAGGTSKWSVKKLFGYAMEGISAFSTKLLLIPLIVGLLLAAVAVLLAVILKICAVTGVLTVTGVGWLALLVLLLAGLQLQCLGVVAFYLGKLFTEEKGRPVYIERVVLSG